MAASFTWSARGLGILGLGLLTGCGGHARRLDDDPVGGGGSLSSAGGARPSASDSSDGVPSGVVGGTAQAGFPGSAGNSGSAGGTTAGGTDGTPTSGGTGGTPTSGGTGGTPTSGAGAGGAGGGVVDIGPPAKAACSSVCSKFNTTRCANAGDLGKTCESDCGSSFAIQNGVCTDLGLEMMACITKTTPSPSFTDCWIQFYDVTQQCYREVNAYKKCVAGVGAGPLPATLCAQTSLVGSGDATPSHCYEDRKCLNGLNYKVDCADTTDHESRCTCQLRDRPIKDFVWPDSTVHACQDALPGCLALAAPLAPVAP